jgi:Family of unknown function (DUF5317)
MVGLLIPALVASLAGALRVGSAAGLQHQRIIWWPLALGSIAVQLALFNPPIDRQAWALALGPWIWIVSLGAFVVVLFRNGASNPTARGAFRLAALGVALNLLVVLANGGYMPQSPSARLAVRGAPLIVPGAAPQLRNVLPSDSDTRLPWLGDVLAQPTWLPTANVVSIGDVVLAVAMAWWAFGAITSVTSERPTQVRRRLADSK